MAVGPAAQQAGTIHVTVPTSRRARRPFIVHFAELPARDRTLRDDIPATSLARTLLDLAGMLSTTRFERVLERSEELQRFDLVALEEVLGRAGHHPGTGRLRRALAIYREDPAFVRSKLEKRFLRLVRDAGLPAPSMNYNVAGFELDAYWGRERFAVELDAYETHGSHAAFERDRLRQEDLKLIGVEMTRVTGPRLAREPSEVMRRVAALLAQRREQLGGG
jgi:very-short-patch-repair endonuclease